MHHAALEHRSKGRLAIAFYVHITRICGILQPVGGCWFQVLTFFFMLRNNTPVLRLVICSHFYIYK